MKVSCWSFSASRRKGSGLGYLYALFIALQAGGIGELVLVNSTLVLRNRVTMQKGDRGKKGGKGGRDGSPEKPGSPSGGLDEECESQRRIILNDEILALRVKPEDLEKIREPKPPSERKNTPTTTSVIVRKVKPPIELLPPKRYSVVVAKPAPPESDILATNYDGIMCARLDENGNIVPHSILGNVEEFTTEALKRGDLPTEIIESCRSLAGERQDKLCVKFEKKAKKRGYPKFESSDESNALKNWQEKMLERKRQQGYLSRLLNKPVDELVMNQGDGFRKTQELRYLINRTIPFIDHGKGYRVGSEFWTQQDQIGGELDGMHVTLSLTEKGYPPPIEHVGVPRCTLTSKGLDSEFPLTTMHKPWHRADYLRQRMINLAPLMDELDPHDPDLLDLEVLGSKVVTEDERCNSINLQMSSDSKKLQKRMECERRYESAHDSCEDPFKEIPDVHPSPIFGPSIQFAGQPARWTGNGHSLSGQVGIEARVSFEAFAGERTTSFLEIVNDGTTCIYYDWKKVTKSNNFDLTTANMQRFYFSPGSGIILPGDTMKFPFVFKSSNAGIFSEQWEFHTHPAVCGGATLLVTLRGVALKMDKFKKQRELLEKDICQKEAQQTVKDILDGLLKGIRSRDRPRSPVDAYITEEEMFQRKNPKLYFSKDKCDQLRDLYSESFPEADRGNVLWDLSLESVRKAILEIGEDDNRKQELLQRLNQIVTSMSSKQMLPEMSDAYRVGYTVLCLGVDKMVQSAMHLSQVTGYYEPRAESSIPSSADSKRSRSGKKKGGGGGGGVGGGKEVKAKEKERVGSGKIVRLGSVFSPEPPTKEETPVPTDTAALESKTRYREKFYTTVYTTMCDIVDEMEKTLEKLHGRKDFDPCTCRPPSEY